MVTLVLLSVEFILAIRGMAFIVFKLLATISSSSSLST